MSFIPSFILSALIFNTVSVPGGWDGTVLSQGIICEVPFTRIAVTVEEQPDVMYALKNGAVIFKFDKQDLKFGAGSLAVTGTSGTSDLTATLPAKTDAAKPLALFASWKKLALLSTTGWSLEALTATNSSVSSSGSFFDKAILQFRPSFLSLKPDSQLNPAIKETLVAGWFLISAGKESSWFLVHPWHVDGNLFYLNNDFALRLTFPHAKTVLTATARLSASDIIVPAAGGALSLLLNTEHTETTFYCSVTQPSFLLPEGSFEKERLTAGADFSFETPLAKKDKSSPALTVTANAAYIQKEPVTFGSVTRQMLSAEIAAAYDGKNDFKAQLSLAADELYLEEDCQNGELTPALKLTFADTAVSGKAAFLPFSENAQAGNASPAWTVKAKKSLAEVTAAYEAAFKGTVLKKQEMSLEYVQDNISLSSAVTIKNAALTWTLSYARTW